MVVLVTGATGNVGRALARVLRREGHDVMAAVRDIARAESALGPEIELVHLGDAQALAQAVERADAVVNLAGAPIADRPWSARRKRVLQESRIGLTRTLAAQIARARRPPRVFVSASAIGIYPDSADALLDERHPSSSGFLGELCAAWEREALAIQSDRTRVVCLRIGVVLDAESGALSKLLPIFRAGLGGPIGNGRQYFSFIHMDDLLRAICFALAQPELRGPVNATAPHPVTNRELSTQLGQLVGRPAWLKVPALALRLFMGQRAQLLLSSQRVLPVALERAGFRFSYPTLGRALAELRGRLDEATRIERNVWTHGDPGPRRATHRLSHVTEVSAPVDTVFPFFAQARNLGWLSPAWMGFAIRGRAPDEVREGMVIEYDIALGPVPMRWRSRIVRFVPGQLFIDDQERGPYAIWWHEHRIEERGGKTRIVDHVWFRLPLSPLGDLVAGRFVHATLRRIFAHRQQALLQRFGAVGNQELAQHAAE